MRTVLPGIYTNIFVLIFRLMRYADVCFFSLSGVRMTLYDSRYALCTRYVYTYDTYVLFQIRTYVPGISQQKSIRTYVIFRPWTHTSDLGPKEACPGLTFVCLSRAKRLVDLMVEPMSFDRIGNLGNSSTMKARLQEEVRLLELAQGTRVRYTDMGVFSAVAGN